MESRRRATVPLRLSNVRFKTTMHNCVAFKVMLARAWVEVFEESDWDIFWYVKTRVDVINVRNLAAPVRQ